MADKYEDTKEEAKKPKPSKPVKIDFDIERASALLAIVKEVSEVAPGYTALSSEAMAELREMNDEIATKAAERTKKQNEELAAQGITVVGGMPVDTATAPATAIASLTSEEQKKADEKAKADAEAVAKAQPKVYEAPKGEKK